MEEIPRTAPAHINSSLRTQSGQVLQGAIVLTVNPPTQESDARVDPRRSGGGTSQNGKLNAGSADALANRNTSGITVLFAGYGTATNGYDVTEQCQALVDSGSGQLITASNLYGGDLDLSFFDPDFGTVKSFGILYQSPIINGGAPVALACAESQGIDTTRGNSAPAPAPVLPSSSSVPQVLYAVYGTAGTIPSGLDVSAACQTLLNSGVSTITATWAGLGLAGTPLDADGWNLCVKYAIPVLENSPPPAGARLMSVLACPMGSSITITT